MSHQAKHGWPCGCQSEVGPNGEFYEHCPLHAAAPEMLEALEAVITSWHAKDANRLKREPEWLKQVRTAVAKAKGQK